MINIRNLLYIFNKYSKNYYFFIYILIYLFALNIKYINKNSDINIFKGKIKKKILIFILINNIL